MEVNYTDEEISLLVIKAQRRDQRAFEALYEQYCLRVSSRVYAILRQVESMQDKQIKLDGTLIHVDKDA